MCGCKKNCNCNCPKPKPIVKPKIKFYYKISQLTKHVIIKVDNYETYIYEGLVYSDVNCTIPLGNFFSEQINNKNTRDNKVTVNVLLPEGNIAYVLYIKSTDGPVAKNTVTNGPLIYGTKKYLFWNSSSYFSSVKSYSDNDTRRVIIYKKINL
jgi:hypothetical protein